MTNTAQVVKLHPSGNRAYQEFVGEPMGQYGPPMYSEDAISIVTVMTSQPKPAGFSLLHPFPESFDGIVSAISTPNAGYPIWVPVLSPTLVMATTPTTTQSDSFTIGDGTL